MLSITSVVFCLLWVYGCERNSDHGFEIRHLKLKDAYRARAIDNAEKILNLSRAELIQARDSIKLANQATAKAHRQTRAIVTRYQAIKFVQYTTPERDSVLSVLFVSNPADTLIIDSLIFEAFKGRSCDSVVNTQAAEIFAQGNELNANARVIHLQEKETANLSFMVDQWHERYDGMADVAELQQKDFKSKVKAIIKKFRKVVIVQGVAIVVLVVLLI